MTAAAADVPRYPARSARPERLQSRVIAAIGASGAVSTTTADDPGFTITRNTTGTYDIAYPKAVNGICMVQLKSAAGTVKGSYWAAWSPTAGTGQLKTHDAATPTVTDPASGDAIWLDFELDMTSAT